MAVPVFVVLVSDGRKRMRKREPQYTVPKESMRLTLCLGRGAMVPAIELRKPTIFARLGHIKRERNRSRTSRKPPFPSRAWNRFWPLSVCRLPLNLPEGVS